MAETKTVLLIASDPGPRGALQRLIEGLGHIVRLPRAGEDPIASGQHDAVVAEIDWESDAPHARVSELRGRSGASPLLVLTPNRHTARRVGLLWGAYAVVTRDVRDFEEMIAKAKRMALRHKLGAAGSRLIVCAGVPFGTPGSTNLLHIVRLTGDELKRS